MGQRGPNRIPGNVDAGASLSITGMASARIGSQLRHQMPYLPSAEQPNDQRTPSLALHTGQAPQPCRARVTSAIAICSSRVARSARGA